MKKTFMVLVVLLAMIVPCFACDVILWDGKDVYKCGADIGNVQLYPKSCFKVEEKWKEKGFSLVGTKNPVEEYGLQDAIKKGEIFIIHNDCEEYRVNECGWQPQEQALLNQSFNRCMKYIKIFGLDSLELDGGTFKKEITEGWISDGINPETQKRLCEKTTICD